MAINFLHNVDLNKNEIQNVALHNLTADPSSPVQGQTYFKTSGTAEVRVSHNGSTFKALAWADASNLTGVVKTLTETDGTFINITTGGTTAKTITADLSATGTANSTKYLRGDNTWATFPTVDNYDHFTLDADTGTAADIDSGETVTISGGTGLSSSISSNTVTVNLDNTAVSAGSYGSATAIPTFTVDAQGRLTAAGTVGISTSWNITDGTTTQTIAGGQTLTVADTDEIEVTVSATDTLTVGHADVSRGDTTSSDSPGNGGNFTVVDSVSSNARGHITAVNVKTVTLPGAENYSWNIKADNDGAGAGSSITKGNTVDLSGGTNITTTRTGDNVEVKLDDSITLAGTLTVNGTGTSSFNGNVNMNSHKITNLLDPTSDQDAATKKYVDDNLVGGLIYQGGYNASTNTPDLDSTPSSNIKKGWTYTVTADGSFFSEQVRVGDVLISEKDAPTAASDWTIVEGNQDLADASTVGLGNVKADASAPSSHEGGAAVNVDYSSGTANLSVRKGTSSQLGLVRIVGGESIDVSYSSGVVTIDHANTNPHAFRVSLTDGGAVTEGGSGETTYTIDISDSTLYDAAVDVLDVTVQVIDNTTGENVYADVRRNTTTDEIIVAFSDTTLTGGEYSALINKVA